MQNSLSPIISKSRTRLYNNNENTEPDNSDPTSILETESSNDLGMESAGVDDNDITKHPEFENYIARTKTETIRQMERNIKARILQKEAKVKSFDELQKYIKLGKEAESIALDNTDNQNTDKDKIPIDIKSIIAEKEKAIETANQEKQKYKDSVLRNKLVVSYIEAGGIPNDKNDDGLKAQDIAVSQLMNTDMFEVDDDFNVSTKAGIDVSKSVELWLKQNHIFKKGEQLKTPSATPVKSNGDNIQNIVAESISKFYK
jgi:hypothetical protein